MASHDSHSPHILGGKLAKLVENNKSLTLSAPTQDPTGSIARSQTESTVEIRLKTTRSLTKPPGPAYPGSFGRAAVAWEGGYRREARICFAWQDSQTMTPWMKKTYYSRQERKGPPGSFCQILINIPYGTWSNQHLQSKFSACSGHNPCQNKQVCGEAEHLWLDEGAGDGPGQTESWQGAHCQSRFKHIQWVWLWERWGHQRFFCTGFFRVPRGFYWRILLIWAKDKVTKKKNVAMSLVDKMPRWRITLSSCPLQVETKFF